MNGKSASVDLVSKRLEGKVAIITGGASGFGEATARLFVNHGAKVVIADVQDDKGHSLCTEITTTAAHAGGGGGGEISYVHCNVTDETDVKNLIDVTISKHGKLDIMFSNAGISGEVDPTIIGSSNENFNKVFNINVFGGYLCAKEAARVMIPSKSGGVILFTASVASVMGGEAPHAYTVSKHELVGLMKNLCVEMGEYGIRVNAISPCGVSTPLLSGATGLEKGVVDGLVCESSVLKGVTPEAQDVANAALYLASDEARFVTGLNLMLDGGYTVTNPSFSIAAQKLFG